MALTFEDIQDLFARHGSSQYSGEPVTQLEHALQTAHLAEQSDADDELVTACLLHDLGHLLNPQGETPTLQGIDDTHQHFVDDVEVLAKEATHSGQVLLAWLAIWIPLGGGVWVTLQKAVALFR